MRDSNADLQQLDDLLFDILKQDERPRVQEAAQNNSDYGMDFVNPYQNHTADKNPILDQISQLKYPDTNGAQLQRYMSPHLEAIDEDHKGEQSNSYKQADFMQAIARKNAD